jgi:PAS domain-containing protein
LEAFVRLLANPMFVRMAAVMLVAIAAFVVAAIALRILRRRFVEDDTLSDWGAQETDYPYSAVIQQLKQQKFELQHEQKQQQRRAKTSEHVTAAVIAGLPCGVLFVAPNGLVRQANVAARQILGYASPLGMSVEEVFRDSRGIAESGAWVRAADVLKNALKGQVRSTDLDFSYDTPAKVPKSLKLALIPLQAPTGEALGVAAVITDETRTADQRQAELLRSETAAEMALELHTSLSTMKECASRIARTDDRELARNLANDITVEAERLSMAVGGFLAGGREKKTFAARA